MLKGWRFAGLFCFVLLKTINAIGTVVIAKAVRELHTPVRQSGWFSTALAQEPKLSNRFCKLRNCSFRSSMSRGSALFFAASGVACGVAPKGENICMA